MSHPTKRPISGQSKKTMLLLIFNTLLALLVYFGCVSAGFSAILVIYVALAAVLLLGYLIYNRGFVLRGATPDMLSDTWTPEQKQEMIEQARQRASDSRIVLAFLVPLVLTILIDVIYLLFLQDVLISLGIHIG